MSYLIISVCVCVCVWGNTPASLFPTKFPGIIESSLRQRNTHFSLSHNKLCCVLKYSERAEADIIVVPEHEIEMAWIVISSRKCTYTHSTQRLTGNGLGQFGQWNDDGYHIQQNESQWDGERERNGERLIEFKM